MPTEPIQSQRLIRELSNVKTRSESRPTAETVSESDAVEISERAQELARAQRAVENAPDVRVDKVAELKKQIDEGSYHVPAEELADMILDVQGGQ